VVDRGQRPKIRLSIKPAVSSSVDTSPVDDGWAEEGEEMEEDLDDEAPQDDLDDAPVPPSAPSPISGRPRQTQPAPPRARAPLPKPTPRTTTPFGVGEPHFALAEPDEPREELDSETEVRRGAIARGTDERGRAILQSSEGEVVIVDEKSIDVEAPPSDVQQQELDIIGVDAFIPAETTVESEAPEPPPPPAPAPPPPQVDPTPLLRTPRPAPKRTVVQLGHALAMLVPLAGTRVPLWSLLGAAIVTTAFVCGLTALALFGTSSDHTEPATSAEPTPSASAAPPSLSDRAAAGDASAIQTLKDKAERSADEVVALSQGESVAKKNELLDLRKQIRDDKKLARDPKTVTLLRKRAYDADVYREAQLLIAGLEGELSADLLYAVWTGTAARTDATQLAEDLVYSKDVRGKASPALAVALDLKRATSCEQRKEILPRAIQYGDQRSLTQLALLRNKFGCGPKKNEDCHACLRDGTALAEAIQSISRRAPPNL